MNVEIVEGTSKKIVFNVYRQNKSHPMDLSKFTSSFIVFDDGDESKLPVEIVENKVEVVMSPSLTVGKGAKELVFECRIYSEEDGSVYEVERGILKILPSKHAYIENPTNA